MKTPEAEQFTEEQFLLENLNPEYFPEHRAMEAIQHDKMLLLEEMKVENPMVAAAHGRAVLPLHASAELRFRWWELSLELAKAKMDAFAKETMFTQKDADYLTTVVGPRIKLDQERIHALHNLNRAMHDMENQNED